MANTRLRKTFQYPADNSDEDEAPRDMDEEGEWKQDGIQASIDASVQSRRSSLRSSEKKTTSATKSTR